MRRGWLLNLHAELERGASSDPLRAARERLDLLARAEGLVPPGDRVLETPEDLARVDAVLAWSPTAAVRALVARAGFGVGRWPSLPTVDRVLSRRWNAERLGLALPGASLVRDRADLHRATSIESPTGSLLLRTMRGFAGKGRRLCRVGAMNETDLRFADKALRDGGLLVEPFVDTTRDLAIHGFIPPKPSGVAGSPLTLGRPVVATLGAGGAWLAARHATPEESLEVAPMLEQEARRAAAALEEDGYWGPFGVDLIGFPPWRGQAWARCEVNARYSMAWAVGMGEARPDLACGALTRATETSSPP
jgi:hypothetical protein